MSWGCKAKQENARTGFWVLRLIFFILLLGDELLLRGRICRSRSGITSIGWT